MPVDGTGRLSSEREHPTAELVGPAGGDLTGSFPNPTVATVNGHTVAIVSSPNTFTAVPQTLNQPAGGGTPLVVNVNAARANIQDVLFKVNTNASYGSMPVFIDNWGQIATPGFISATGATGVGPVGGYSYMIAANSDISTSQPTFISQVPNTNNWHFLFQNGNRTNGLLISGGGDHPLASFGEDTPVFQWSQTSGHVFDTKLYRWGGGGPILAADPGLAILNAAGSSADLKWGDKTSGTYWRAYYDGTAGLYIKDDRHGSTLITLGAAATGSLGFYGSSGVVQASRAGQLTDSTGGSVSTTLAAGITDAVAKNAIASLAAKVNALETIVHNLGLSA